MAKYALTPPLDRIPFVLDMVDVNSEKWSALAAVAGLPRRLIYRREALRLRQFEAEVTAQAAATTVVHERERRLLQSINPQATIEVISNGFDSGPYRPPAEASP